MKKVIIYDEYSIESNSIAWFWNFMVRCDDDMKKKFIFFTTGSFRIPQGGFKSFKITIRRVDNVNDQLPVAHTCTKSFDLPEYKSEEVFNEKVTLSLKEGIKGFNIE